eukprot:2843582-Amphidinium_carterae.1
MDTITSQAAVLVINATRGGETQQLPTNLVIWRIAGDEPQAQGGHKCIRLTGNTTQVIRMKLTKSIKGQGVWIPPVLTVKDFKHVVKAVHPSLSGRLCDVWQLPGMETTQVFLARVLQADLHSVLADGVHAGIQVVGGAASADSMKVLWLKAQNLADAKKEAADLICELPEDQDWRRASALCLRQEKNKLSYGVRVRADDFAKVASAAGRDQRQRFVLTGCLQSWISFDVKTVCQELEWKAESKAVTKGLQYVWIREYEVRNRRSPTREPEMRNGQRSWASVVQGPVAIKPAHQHEDHEKDFWELIESDTDDDHKWEDPEVPSDQELSADEWANNCWYGWWQPQAELLLETGDAQMEQHDKRPCDDGLNDSWVEVHTKRQKRVQEAAEKRTRANRSSTGSEEEPTTKQPKCENAPPGLADLIQELRDEKAQLRAENRELKAKLDELLARLASTGIDGDHIEQDAAAGQHLTFPRTFASEVHHQIALYRHPWNATRQQLIPGDLDNVLARNAGRRGPYGCIPTSRTAQATGFGLCPRECGLAAAFQGLPTTYEQAFRHDLGANNLASDKSVLAASDYYGLNITVLFSEEQAAWHYVPPNQPITHPSHVLWLEAQHFQRGPLKDLGAALRHALPIAGGNDQRFHGGRQLTTAIGAASYTAQDWMPVQGGWLKGEHAPSISCRQVRRRRFTTIRQVSGEEAYENLRVSIPQDCREPSTDFQL